MNYCKSRYIVCYDISDDKRRDKIATLLLDYGVRVQFSIFEVVAGKTLFDSLIRKINAAIDPEKDKILAYALCAACDRKTLRMGAQTKEAHGNELLFVV